MLTYANVMHTCNGRRHSTQNAVLWLAGLQVGGASQLANVVRQQWLDDARSTRRTRNNTAYKLYLSICLSVHLSVYLSVHLSVYLSVYIYMSTCLSGWLSSRVVSVLDSGAVGPEFKSQLRRCRVTVLGKLFTPIVPLFTKQRNW